MRDGMLRTQSPNVGFGAVGAAAGAAPSMVEGAAWD